MIIYKNNKGYQTLSGSENENILTITQRRKLQEADQAEKEMEYIENRLIELTTLESTPETEREKKEQESRQMFAQAKQLTTAQKEALSAEITTLDSTVYVVPDGSDLAEKIISAYPCYNFIEDENGTLIDIEVLPKPNPLPPEPTTEELQTEQNIDFDYRLSMIDLGL